MIAQKEAAKVADLKEMVQELADSHHLTAKMVHDLCRRLGDIGDQRQFGLLVAANASDEGLEFLRVLGDSARMVSKK